MLHYIFLFKLQTLKHELNIFNISYAFNKAHTRIIPNIICLHRCAVVLLRWYHWCYFDISTPMRLKMWNFNCMECVIYFSHIYFTVNFSPKFHTLATNSNASQLKLNFLSSDKIVTTLPLHCNMHSNGVYVYNVECMLYCTHQGHLHTFHMKYTLRTWFSVHIAFAKVSTRPYSLNINILLGNNSTSTNTTQTLNSTATTTTNANTNTVKRCRKKMSLNLFSAKCQYVSAMYIYGYQTDI